MKQENSTNGCFEAVTRQNERDGKRCMAENNCCLEYLTCEVNIIRSMVPDAKLYFAVEGNTKLTTQDAKLTYSGRKMYATI